MDEEDQSVSALRENIQRKGVNSYYYGHATVRTGPEWDGNEAPRLLAVEEVGSGSSAKNVRLASAFDSYSWGDEKKSIKVYVDFEGAQSIPEENISLETTATSLTFSLSDVGGKDYKLVLSPLSQEISSGSFRKKDAMIVLTLKKEVESTWFSLLKK